MAALFVAGCATSGAARRPADFPLHNEAPPVAFHWRLTEDPTAVRADGLVERRNHLIAGAWLQLLGLDAAGRVVSFTTPDARPLDLRGGPGVVRDPAPAPGGRAAVRDAPLLLRVSGGEYPVDVATTVEWGACMKLDSFARYPFLFGPSPVHPLERLSAHLGGARVWAKRDDCNSGLAFGGNKIRKLEYLVADAIAAGMRHARLHRRGPVEPHPPGGGGRGPGQGCAVC